LEGYLSFDIYNCKKACVIHDFLASNFFSHIFNWTWSYRANSDVVAPYGNAFFPKGKKPPSSNWKPQKLIKLDMKK